MNTRLEAASDTPQKRSRKTKYKRKKKHIKVSFFAVFVFVRHSPKYCHFCMYIVVGYTVYIYWYMLELHRNSNDLTDCRDQ